MKICPETRSIAKSWETGYHWSYQALLAGLSFLTQSVGRLFLTCYQQCLEDFTDLWRFSRPALQNVWNFSLNCEDFPDLLSKMFGKGRGRKTWSPSAPSLLYENLLCGRLARAALQIIFVYHISEIKKYMISRICYIYNSSGDGDIQYLVICISS